MVRANEVPHERSPDALLRRTRRRCTLCHENGHNIRTCPQRLQCTTESPLAGEGDARAAVLEGGSNGVEHPRRLPASTSGGRHELPFVFLLNLKTRGFSSKDCKITEIACIRCRMEKDCLVPEAEYTTLVQPQDGAHVTGAATGSVAGSDSNALLRAALPLEAAAPQFLGFILSGRATDEKKFLLCAHNGDLFDFPGLMREMASVGVSLLESPAVLVDIRRLLRSTRCLERQSSVHPCGYSLPELYTWCTGKRGDHRQWNSALDDARALFPVCNDQRVLGLLRPLASTSALQPSGLRASPGIEPPPSGSEPNAEQSDAQTIDETEDGWSSDSEGLDLASMDGSGSSDLRSDSFECDSDGEGKGTAPQFSEPERDLLWQRGSESHFACETEFVPYTPVSEGNVGTPLDSFLKIYNAVEELVVASTNSYAERKLAGLVIVSALRWKRAIWRRQCSEEHVQCFMDFLGACQNRKHWKPVTEAEMRRYLGLHVLAEACAQTTSRRFWWSEKKYFGWEAATKAMCQRRFDEITKFLHVAPWPYCMDEGSAAFDSMQKVREFASTLFGTFNALYSPSQDVTVHGIVVNFTNRTRISVSDLHESSARRGVRVVAAVDRTTRYILNAIAYTGSGRNSSAFYRTGVHQANADTENIDRLSLTAQSVCKLMKPYFHHGHVMYCDPFFTSVELFEHLLSNGTFACGTAKPRLGGFPRDLFPRDQVRAASRGTAFHAVRGNMVAMAWKDRKVIHALSTCSSTDEFDLAYRRVSSDVIALRRPRLLSVYDDRMRGADVFQQFRSCVGTETSNGSKWWHHIFFWLIDAALNNGHVLHCAGSGEDMPMRAYRYAVGVALLSFGEETPSSRDRSSELPMTKHFLVKVKDTCLLSGRKRTRVHNCVVCSCRSHGKNPHRTPYVCQHCQVPLCSRDGTGRDCFQVFHSDLAHWVAVAERNKKHAPAGKKRNISL